MVSSPKGKLIVMFLRCFKVFKGTRTNKLPISKPLIKSILSDESFVFLLLLISQVQKNNERTENIKKKLTDSRNLTRL